MIIIFIFVVVVIVIKDFALAAAAAAAASSGTVLDVVDFTIFDFSLSLFLFLFHVLCVCDDYNDGYDREKNGYDVRDKVQRKKSVVVEPVVDDSFLTRRHKAEDVLERVREQ